jgi:hypothetical protein
MIAETLKLSTSDSGIEDKTGRVWSVMAAPRRRQQAMDKLFNDAAISVQTSHNNVLDLISEVQVQAFRAKLAAQAAADGRKP